LVITTGPDHRQVVTVLWKEIRRALKQSKVPLGFDYLTEGMGSPQRLVVRDGGDWQALGFAAGSPEGFSGQHADQLLVIVDEATGVSRDIWGSIYGLVAKRIVAVGNPIRRDCEFFDLHEKAGVGGIHSVTISSLECPGTDGMADASFLDQMREIHGEASPWWRSNILGLFPGEESVRFLPLNWLDACVADGVMLDPLWRDYPEGDPIMGVDIGGGVGADASAVVVRNRKRILEAWSSRDHGVLDDARNRLEPVVAEMQRKWRVPPSRIIYDKGGVGRSFDSYMAKPPYSLVGMIGHFGAGRGGPFYTNRRTANAFALRKRLDPHRKDHVPFYCGGPHWPQLRKELSELRTPETVMEEGTFKQKLEPKEAMSSRLGGSPDLLDALLMTFFVVD
jgi:hypothetical protein